MSRRTFGVLASLTLAILLLAPAAEAQFGKNKIRYQDFKWEVYHSTHFDVYYYPEAEDLLERVVSIAESAYDQLSQDFNYQIEDPTPLIFYETHEDFEQNNIILNFIPEGLGAFASPVRNRMVMPVDMPDPELMALMLHELTHIFQYHVVFGGSLSKGVASRPPLWFMEGMASYMAEDETARDKMFLRDAVVNDRLPPVTSDFGGYFAYRFGHAVFDYIEEKYGKEGVRDFMIETRNTLGARVGRAMERAFGEDPEDVNADFRRWLRKKYLPELIDSGEPGDFGRPFRRAPGARSQQTSPAASPSGDLLVAFSASGDTGSLTGSPQIDLLLYDTEKREVVRNLTKGLDKEFSYYVAQELTMAREYGRDISFSPDGNEAAFFARRNEGRALVLVDVLKGGVREVIPMDVQQQAAPAWSADGRTIAFSGHREGQFDIFTYDLETGAIDQLTNDTIYDAAPSYSPDGRSIAITSVVGDYSKLFRIDVDNPGERFPLTHGETNDNDPVYSQDGKRIYYTSDLTGANNIYSLEADTGAIRQHTDSVTGCFQPTVLGGLLDAERLVYTCYWKGRFDLYLLDTAEPITEPTLIAASGEGETGEVRTTDLTPFEPAIEVSIDDRNRDKYRGGKFFLENVGGGAGISDDQTVIANAVLYFSDFLGDRRIVTTFQSIESFQNFDVIYADLSRRWQWQAHLFDDRDFFIGIDELGQIRRGQAGFTQTGAIFSVSYPFSVTRRVELGAGFVLREVDFQTFAIDENGNPVLDDMGNRILTIVPREDEYPLVTAALVGDSTVASRWGLVSGRRWRIGGNYAPDLDAEGDDGSTLTQSLSVDYRQYIPVTRRSNFAVRLVGFLNDGNFANPVYFGGLDTVRGFEFRSLVGDRGFYTNFEYRFPLFDFLATPIANFQGIRARLFLDVAGAWFDGAQEFDFWDNENDQLEDAVASYGWGFSVNLFGLPFHWDFAKRTNFEDSESSFETSWWIGTRF